jgi:phosphoribosylaminoimidazole carboxylase (NCAIR synthetase)
VSCRAWKEPGKQEITGRSRKNREGWQLWERYQKIQMYCFEKQQKRLHRKKQHINSVAASKVPRSGISPDSPERE